MDDRLKLDDYLTIKRAAAFLGVSPDTLRNWDRAGKLAPQRHPVNGYRLYRREDLARVLEALDAAAPSSQAPPLAPGLPPHAAASPYEASTVDAEVASIWSQEQAMGSGPPGCVQPPAGSP